MPTVWWAFWGTLLWIVLPWAPPGPSPPSVAHTIECAEEITENLKLQRSLDWWRRLLLLLVALIVVALAILGVLLASGLLLIQVTYRGAPCVKDIRREPTAAERVRVRQARQSRAHVML